MTNLHNLCMGTWVSLNKGRTHRATEALRWLSISTYRCIESVCRSVGTLFSCDIASAFIETVMNAKCYFWVSTKFKHS